MPRQSSRTTYFMLTSPFSLTSRREHTSFHLLMIIGNISANLANKLRQSTTITMTRWAYASVMTGLPFILSDDTSLIDTPPSLSLCTPTERTLVGRQAIFCAYVIPAFSHKRTVVPSLFITNKRQAFPCNLLSLLPSLLPCSPSPNVYFLMLA